VDAEFVRLLSRIQREMEMDMIGMMVTGGVRVR
jgi:hypothetical protein